MITQSDIQTLYQQYKGKYKAKIQNEGIPILEKWKKYRNKILSGTITLDEYTNRVPNEYLCNFAENGTKFFGDSHAGQATHFMIKINTDGTYFLEKWGVNIKNKYANKQEAEAYFDSYIKPLLYDIVNCKDYNALITVANSVNFQQYHSKNTLLKIILLESLVRKNVNFYSTFLMMYEPSVINYLYTEFGLSGTTNNRIQKNYEVLKKCYEMLGITETDKNIETSYEVYQMLLDVCKKHGFFQPKNNTTDNEIKEGKDNMSQEKDSTPKNLSNKFPKNLILYGPPGTGKTYNSIIYAVAIVEGRTLEDVQKQAKNDYSAVKSSYDKYIEEGKIAFTTFHQSYGYEDFIEGIKPESDNNGDITYNVKNGVFKDFCENAASTIITRNISNASIGNNPTFWKVSLKGTGANAIRTDCLKNNRIRIAFDSYGKEITEETDFSNEGGRNVLNAFIYGMKQGDIILSCFTNNSIDAIGVITGDYEWDENLPDYKRIRKVEWLVKREIKDIDKHNGNKTFTLGTVYRLNDIDKEWIYKIIEEENGKTDNIEKSDNDSPRVFIIDEINRGNISKIFGELITLIEDTKRLGQKEEMKAKLPYSQKEFGVPNNVYILGTMNTADRSISLIDTALRRRFAFKEMMPDSDLLDGVMVDNTINVKNVLDTINKRIEYLYDREHQIGHSFFMKLNDNRTMENLSDIFKDKIIPLLQEYFYDDYEKIRLVLGDNQKKDENTQFIKKVQKKSKDLFGDDKDNDFDDKAVFEINYGAFKDPQSYRFLANGQIKDTESDDGNTAQAEAAATENE